LCKNGFKIREPFQKPSVRVKLSRPHSMRGDFDNGSIPDYCRCTTFAATFSRKFAGFGGIQATGIGIESDVASSGYG